MGGQVILRLTLLCMLSSCTFSYNATHPHNHSSEAELAAEAERLRSTGHHAMADRLEREEHEKRQAPMWCMFGDMGLLVGGAGALQGARSLGVSPEMVEPINLAGLATSAIVFLSLGYSVYHWGHL
jgi:hypothetical protein